MLFRFKAQTPSQAPAFQPPPTPPTLNPTAAAPISMPPPIPAQAQNMGGFQATAVNKRRVPTANNSGKRNFYIFFAVVVAGLIYLVTADKKPAAKDPNAFRTSAVSAQDMAEAEKRSAELLNIKKEKYDSVQYRRAQENFIRAFRDFQQGQYARAREAFQVVLNLDPDNELAKRYYHLSKIKFDELVKFNMIQGNRYREKKNWRMCQSNYSNVMTMLLNRKDDPSFKEAKQYYEECKIGRVHV